MRFIAHVSEGSPDLYELEHDIQEEETKPGVSWILGHISECLGTFLFITTWGERGFGATDVQWIQPGMAVKDPQGSEQPP